MVGGLVPRYDSGGGGRCTLQVYVLSHFFFVPPFTSTSPHPHDSGGGGRFTLQAQYERRGEGELLSRRGGGTLHERATL